MTSMVRFGDDLPSDQLELDGIRYRVVVPIVRMSSTPGELRLDFDGFEVIAPCARCGRSDLVPRVAHSWEEAVDRGWLVAADPASAAMAGVVSGDGDDR